MATGRYKVTIHMVPSLDGIIAKKDNSVSWFDVSDYYEKGVTEQNTEEFLKTIDCYVLGARTYEHALELSKPYGWAYGDVPNPEKKKLQTTDKKYKRINKNAITGIDLNKGAYQYFGGVDLMNIEGLGHATVLSIISEVGPEGFTKFATAKHFTSWLRLAPNNKISGGKLLSTKTLKGSNRLKIALRNAANAVGNLSDTHLSNFFKRVC